MGKRKLNTKHKIFLMLVHLQELSEPERINYTNREISRKFKEIWNIKISRRHLTRLLTQLEKDGAIKRHMYARRYGKLGNQAQANRYEIIELEKGLNDLV